MNTTPRPIIGVTLDCEAPGGYSKFPWYALRQNYADAIIAAGGLPMALPHEPDARRRLSRPHRRAGRHRRRLRRRSGAVRRHGAQHATVTLKAGRTAAELALTQGALARGMPVLGICGGEQLLAVALGGTLIQHIPDAIPDALAHEQPNPRHEPGHAVTVVPGTLLHRIVGSTTMQVNSSHHQAVRDPGRDAMVNALAPDGVVEGIEDAALPLLPGRAVASRILHRSRRPPHLRRPDRRLRPVSDPPDGEAGPRGDRIAKWLARAGVASRRDAEKLLTEGKVRLNNQTVTHPATFVDARRPRDGGRHARSIRPSAPACGATTSPTAW